MYTHNKSLKSLLYCAKGEIVSKPNHSKKANNISMGKTNDCGKNLLLVFLQKNKSVFC